MRFLILLILLSFLLAGCTGEQTESVSGFSPKNILENVFGDKHTELMKESERYSELSEKAQEFIINTEWIKDGVDEGDIRYIDSIPVSFDPDNTTADTDKGGLEDCWEVMYRGNVTDGSDDIPLLLNYSYYIPEKGFLTFPVYYEDAKRASYIWYDEYPRVGYVKNWKGESDTATPNQPNYRIWVKDQHFAIDIVDLPDGTPIIAPADGVVTWMREKDDILGSYIIMTISHPNGMDTHYGEVNKDAWHVKVGDKVKRGEIIGYIAPRYHELHFQVQTQPSEGKPTVQVDPFKSMTDPNSKSYWIFGNTPLALSKSGAWLRLNFSDT